MIKSKSAKVFAGFIGLTMALGTFAIPAGAQTTAELTAQINSLLAMIAQLQAQIAGGGSTGGASMTFTSDLTIGSTGSEVTALQQWLVQKGYLTMPAGVAMGYFGSLTQSALAKYQAEAGISPAAGYFGPITRAKVNAMTGTGSTGGTGTGTGSTGTGITTPGVEGTLAVTNNNSGIESTVYEGESMVSILGFNVEAKNSDLAVQRIKLDLGTATTIYNKIYSKIYVTDGSNVLASMDLNSSNVIKDGGTYYITIAGFNFIVPKGTKKQMVIKVDVRDSIDSGDLSSNYTVRFPTAGSGVRAVDGAGIDQYAGDGDDIFKSMNVDSDLTDSATLKMSLNTSSPKKAQVVASSGTDENELDKLSALVFDLKAEKDDVTVTDLNIQVSVSNESTGADASTTVYLYDGSTEIDSASVTSGVAVFSDLDYTVPRDTTKTLTAKVDIRNATAVASNVTLSASSTGTPAENTIGDTLSASERTGSATGYALTLVSVGPEVTLVSKSIVTDGVAQTDSTPLSTSTLTATFNIKVKAVGGDLMLGTAASGTPAFASSTTSFKVYKNGAYDSTISASATSTSYTTPSGVTTSGLTNSFTLSEGNEVTIPVTFQITGRKSSSTALPSALYAVGFEGLQYVANGTAYTTSFMAGEADWRTADVSFP